MDSNSEENVDELRLQVLADEFHDILTRFEKKNKLNRIEIFKILTANLLQKMHDAQFSKELAIGLFGRISASYCYSFDQIDDLKETMKAKEKL